MAVTHADLSLDRGRSDHGAKLGVVLIVLSILCGLSCFILCLIAEALRTEATWRFTGSEENKGRQKEECVYSGSGRTALFCALGAFVMLACAMVMKHSYILVAVTRPIPHPLISSSSNSASGALIWQACFFFISTWICFSVGEVLLMIGISVESGHLKDWNKPRVNCLVNREGLLATAGVFGLTTVFLAAGLYFTALRAQTLHHEEATIRREVLEASYMYSTPISSPTHEIPRGLPQSTRAMQENAAQPSPATLPAYTEKPSNSV